MTREEAFTLWSDKHDLADGLPWEVHPDVLRTAFNAGWDAKIEAAKQTDMFPVATAEGQDVGGVTAADIYDAYPRKVGKAGALKAIEKAMRVSDRTPANLLQQTKAYAAAVKTWPPTARYTVAGVDTVPHPATWFNRGSYDDPPEEWQRGASKHAPSQFGRTYQ